MRLNIYAKTYCCPTATDINLRISSCLSANPKERGDNQYNCGRDNADDREP